MEVMYPKGPTSTLSVTSPAISINTPGAYTEGGASAQYLEEIRHGPSSLEPAGTNQANPLFGQARGLCSWLGRCQTNLGCGREQP